MANHGAMSAQQSGFCGGMDAAQGPFPSAQCAASAELAAMAGHAPWGQGSGSAGAQLEGDGMPGGAGAMGGGPISDQGGITLNAHAQGSEFGAQLSSTHPAELVCPVPGHLLTSLTSSRQRQ